MKIILFFSCVFNCSTSLDKHPAMAAFWLAAIPSGIWATKALGNSINGALFSPNRAEGPNLLLDHQGALACARAVLKIQPVSPTASHLRELVRQSAEKLAKLVEETEARIKKYSWSRMFRDPDFSCENRMTRAEIDTLKSRVSLFLTVVQIFPLQWKQTSVPFQKSLPEDHESIDSEEESDSEEDTSNSDFAKSGTDSLGSFSEEDLQPIEVSFWQSLLAKAGSIDLSTRLAGPDNSGDQDGDEDTGGAQNDECEH